MNEPEASPVLDARLLLSAVAVWGSSAVGILFGPVGAWYWRWRVRFQRHSSLTWLCAGHQRGGYESCWLHCCSVPGVVPSAGGGRPRRRGTH